MLENNLSENIKEIPNREPNQAKPNILLSLVSGLMYFGLFFFAQYAITFVLMIYYGTAKVAEDAANGVSFNAEELTAYLEALIYEKINLVFILYVSLFVFILIVFFAIRKKSFWKETRIVPFPAKYIPAVLVLSVGLFFFLNAILNLMPQSWIADYSESASFITEGALWVSLITKGLLAPLSEELTFRGLMLSRFNRALPKWVGILISSVLFGLVHGQALWFFYAMVLGMILCLIAIRTKSILSTFLIHSLFNLGGVFISYVEFPITLPIIIAAVILGVILLAIGFYLTYGRKTIAA